MASGLYDKGFLNLMASGSTDYFSGTVIGAMMMDENYVFNKSASFVADITGSENAFSSRATVDNFTPIITGSQVRFDSDNISFSAISDGSGSGVALFNSSSSDSTSELFSFVSFPTLAFSGNAAIVTVNSGGLFFIENNT